MNEMKKKRLIVYVKLQTPLDSISRYLRETYDDRLKNDVTLQKRIQDREALPIFQVKNALMEALHENPVVIIRGNTGCGKTTQVS